jgi:transposase
MLHIIALSQIRSNDHAGRVYYDRKRREGKTHRGAMRSLKRQLCTVVYYRLRSCRFSVMGEQDATRVA